MEQIIIGSIPMLIALVISIIQYKKLEPRLLRFFTWYLITTILIQTSGYLYSKFLHKSNHFIFNIYTLIDYGFYMIIFYKIIQKPQLKRLTLLMTLFFVSFYFIELFIINSFFIYNSLTGNVGEFVTLCCCFFYFAELLMAEESVNFFKIPMFWITTGIMIAAIGDFMYMAFFDYILANKLDPDGKVYGILTTILSIIECSFFAIAFLCKPVWIKAR